MKLAKFFPISVHRAAVIDLYKQESDSVWKNGNWKLELGFKI